MRVLILGGDGYLGWPQALYLSRRGFDVCIVDNLARRTFDRRVGHRSLLALDTPEGRVKHWQDLTGRSISFVRASVVRYGALLQIFRDFRPDTVVHFAEQRSAPYSMVDRRHATSTQVNNIVGTLNVIYCIAEVNRDCHLVKLGTMGEYGTPNIDIEEGFLSLTHNGRTDRVPFPKQPGSFYHLSKVHDSHNIMFACKTWGIRCTDLNQGVVYGWSTAETREHPSLHTRFDYDHIYGTALNRFCVQAALDQPITVYGKGNQVRGWIDIQDTVRCIELAITTPPADGEYRVFNQFTEQYSLNELAAQVSRVARTRGRLGTLSHLRNPRTEAEDHYYNAVHTGLEELGLRPHLLSDEAIDGTLEVVERQSDRVDLRTITPRVDWRRIHNSLDSAR